MNTTQCELKNSGLLQPGINNLYNLRRGPARKMHSILKVGGIGTEFIQLWRIQINDWFARLEERLNLYAIVKVS